ncbi:MAG: SPOR domain-containing protein [Tatlockia sp.]|nr:SPOR domain-containing protein [Tatlockia sp.]
MIKKLQFLGLCLCASALTACVNSDSNYHNFQSYYTTYNSQPYGEETAQYSQTADYSENDNYRQSTATVPDSYYTGSTRTPTSHKDLDRNWVNGQNPKAYTIQVGESEKASQVADRLYKAPKSDRSAEIKYSRDGRTYYKGVHGSYNNYEDAQKALNNLPQELKQGADIKPWSTVQENN